MAIVKSIKGTTSEVMAAQGAGDIGIETSVTITDNLYTAANLLAIIGDTRKTITLTYTAAAFPITESTENLVAILAQVNKYTGPLSTNDTSTAEELNYIAKKTTGTVTAELVNTTPITKATVDALKDVNSSDIIKFEPTPGTVSGKAALEALVALGKKLPNTDWTGVTDFEGTASEVAAIKAALKVVEDANVTIAPSGQISAADANALVVASNGIVTATIKDGSVAATLKALKDVDGDLQANVLTFKSTDKTADAQALVDLDALLDTSNFASVQTITSKAADIGTNGKNVTDALALATVGDPAVTITNGTITATNAGLISTATNGKVTATITPDTANAIATALTTAAPTDALSITVNGANANVADLNAIDTQTALKVKVDSATVTATTYAEFEGIYVTNKNNFSNLGDENITVTAPFINSAQADIVAKATSKVAKATINGETAASVVTNLKNANAKDDFTINLTNAATSAKDLLTLDGKTSINVNATAIALAITGTVAEVNKLLVAGVDLNPNPAFTLTGTVKAADANYIALNSGVTGVVTATIAADTAAKLNVALVNAKATDMLKLTVNGSTASVTDLNALAGKTAVAADAIKVDAKEITGAGADLVALYANAKFDNLGNENVKVEGTVLVTNLSTILAATTSIVTASLTDTAANLAAITGATNGKDALTLKVINDAGATTAANLKALDGFTSVKVDASGITNGITGNAADLKAVITSKGIELAKGVDITVTGPISAADLNVILKSTLGAVTASVTDTAAKLNAALKDASSSDVLTLTLSAGTAAAKDLLALDGKTSVAVNASAVTAITGTFVDVQKVVDAGIASTITLDANVNYTISDTVTAAQAEIIADSTGGVVTATVAADTASNLVRDLADGDINAYKLTVSGNDANASDLNSLDDKTSLAVNANAIKNIIGTGATGAEDVRDAYLANAHKDISGLGNETVNLTGAADADVALVNAINAYTTGVITLPELVLTNTGAATFNLKQLGDLKGITGLVSIDAETNTQVDTINISLKDLLEANDSKANFTLSLDVEATDFVNITNDVSGWTKAEITLDTKYTYTNAKTGQVVTIVADEAVINA